MTWQGPRSRQASADALESAWWRGKQSGAAEFALDQRLRRGQPGANVWEASMLSKQHVRHLLRASVLAMVGLGIASATAEEISDWPCDAPFAEQFDPVQVWGSGLPRPLAEGWRRDEGVREVVEFAANPENPPRLGVQRITKFAAPLGAEREEQLMLVFAGLLDQFNLLRGFVIEGVRDFVLRAKILREAVDRNEAEAAALPTEATEEQRRGHLEAGAWDARRMDDAMEEAEFLCHRYDYLDKKLGELTAGIRAAL